MTSGARPATTADINSMVGELREGEPSDRFANATTVLEPNASPEAPLWVLIISVSGVVWGRYDGHRMALAKDKIPGIELPDVDPASLLQARIFGSAGELFIWRDDDQESLGDHRLSGRWIVDDIAAPDDYDVSLVPAPRSEAALVGGTRLGDTADGFTILEGESGRRQVVPFALTEAPSETRPSPLKVTRRIYRAPAPDTGALQTVAFRLVNVDLTDQPRQNGDTHAIQ